MDCDTACTVLRSPAPVSRLGNRLCGNRPTDRNHLSCLYLPRRSSSTRSSPRLRPRRQCRRRPRSSLASPTQIQTCARLGRGPSRSLTALQLQCPAGPRAPPTQPLCLALAQPLAGAEKGRLDLYQSDGGSWAVRVASALLPPGCAYCVCMQVEGRVSDISLPQHCRHLASMHKTAHVCASM